MKIILICFITWIISILILVPCLILSAISGLNRDYHQEFHDWWGDNILDKLDKKNERKR